MEAKACDELYRQAAEPYIKRHREYWSKQENIDRHNAETAEYRKNNPDLLIGDWKKYAGKKYGGDAE